MVNFSQQAPARPIDMRHASKVHEEPFLPQRNRQILPCYVQCGNIGSGNLPFDLHGYGVPMRLMYRHSHCFS